MLHAVAGKLSVEFCKSPDFKKLSCGWATEDELAKTSRTCNLCGTIWTGEVKTLPYVFEPFNGYASSRSPRFVSLACRPGKLLVRAVFKMLTVQNDDVGVVLNLGWGSMNTLGSNESSVRRCDLELPPHEKAASPKDTRKSDTSTSEIEAALRSKEVNCKRASAFPVKVGQWYSDTATFDYSGCKGVEQKGEYKPTMPYIVRNPGPGFLLAKFEVQEA